MTITPLRQADYHWKHKSNYDRQQKLDASLELAEWSIFSNAQISTFTGLDPHDVAQFSGKTDRTGGRLDGEALAPIIDLVALLERDEVSDPAVRRALHAGVSTGMLARLTGVPQTNLRRWARRAA